MIQLTNINKIYNKGSSTQVHALKDVNFSASVGDLISITGPSGSGKSTLLHILAGIDNPTSGEYFYNGKNVLKMKEKEKCMLRNKNIGIIMQDFGLLGSDSVLLNVCLPQIIGNEYTKLTAERAKHILDDLGLANSINKPVNQLSGGQKQRCAIARALTMEAKVILADEPTGALDTKNTESLMKVFRDISENGVTVILVTHNELVADSCSYKYRLIDGNLIKLY